MAPSPTSETAPQTERDRDVLVDCASALFNAHGIQAVGMDAIRAGAGVPLKRVYKAFRSKDDLVSATLRRRDADTVEALSAFLEARVGDDPVERVLAVFDWMRDWFADAGFRGCAFVNAFGELGGDAEYVATPVRDHKRAFRELLRRLVAEIGLPEHETDVLADRLALVANGAMVLAPITGSPATADDAKATARVLIDAAVRASGKEKTAGR